MQPVSVVIPLFNKQAYILRTLESVKAQTHRFFEVLVIDDGSTDRGAWIARDFEDDRVRVIHCSWHGTSAARNTGIEAAKYPLIAFLDADDTWHPGFLDAVLALYKKYPHAGLFATGYQTANAGRLRSVHIKGLVRKKTHMLLPNYFTSVLGSIPVIASAVMVPRTVFDTCGRFAYGAQLGEDQDMWARIALKFKVAYDKRPFAVYHLDAQGSVCRDISIMQQYPVIHTVAKAIELGQAKNRTLKRYLSKLHLDYAIRLIRAKRLREARAAIKRAGLRSGKLRIRTEYYLFRAALERLFTRG